MAAKAAHLGQPGLGLTDHGVMSGVFQLYKACKKAGILPFPGVELYVTTTLEKTEKRHHLTAFALSQKGYKGLVRFSSLTHQRDHYHYKPRASWADLAAFGAEYGHEVVITSGCFFGPVQQAIARGDVEQAETLVQMLAHWFPWFHVEIQHHDTPGHEITDDDMAITLFDIAERTGVPVLITQDCHYLHHAHAELHKQMKGIVYSSDVGDVAFPGDSYHLSTSSWVQSHFIEHPKIWDASQESMAALVERHQLDIPFLDSYRYWVPKLADDPDLTLRQICYQRQFTSDSVHKARLDEELDVIAQTGFAGYFLLVHDYVQWARDQGIYIRARGSAGGSLVCYLLGFTATDPILWDLDFDRFLTPDRERPPDIDLDVEDARRDEVIAYLKKRWGVVQIGTFNKIGLDEAGGGSLLQQFLAAHRKLSGGSPEFFRRYGSIKTMDDLAAVDHQAATLLTELDDLRIRKSAGAHAAGYVIGTQDHPIEDWLPTMLIASSESVVTQMEMDDVEDAGFLKLDVLGLRSLATLRRIHELVGHSVEMNWDDPDVFKFLRKGRAQTGIFQFEGFTSAKGLREMRVKTIEDLFITNAIYRPATRNSGLTDLYIERRNGAEWKLPHELLTPVLGPTLGIPCYQEQVLRIARLVGMDSVDRNKLLKATKVKHGKQGMSEASTKAFENARDQFIRCAVDSGMTKREADETWKLIEGFAAYGFNKAHAVSYSLLGYELAYWKVHHPLEFHAALLETSAGSVKEPDYVDETRKCKIRILRPDVNISKTLYTIDHERGAIRRGLSSVKGVGIKAAEAIAERAPFISIEDLIERCPGRPVSGGKNWSKEGTLNGVLLALQNAGALRSLGVLPQ